ncbi:MAG: hypothetical protein M1815_000370 [Lichina confinis]|nr:MAG: hypothetical protein M1815_000370 [Lichina confinis]
MASPSASTETTEAPPGPSEPSYGALLSQLRTTCPTPLLPPSKAHTPSLTSVIASLALHPTLEAALHMLNHDLVSAHFLVRHMQAPPAYEGMLLHAILHRIEGDYDNARVWYRDVSRSDVFRHAWGEPRDGDDDEGGNQGGNDDSDEDENVDDDGKKDNDRDLDKVVTFLSRVQRLKQTGASQNHPSSHPKPPPQSIPTTAPSPSPAAAAASPSQCQSPAADEHTHLISHLTSQSQRELDRVIGWCDKKFGHEPWLDASDAWVRPSDKIRKIGQDMVTGGAGFRKF